MIELRDHLLTIIGLLVFVICGFIKGDKILKQILLYIKLTYNTIKFKQLLPIATLVLTKKMYITPILDEMIGYFESTHIGLYTFHNGVIDVNNNHLLKLSMIDERSRLHSLILEHQNLPISIFSNIIYDCITEDTSFADVQSDENIFLKQTYSQITNTNYCYYTIQWENGVPLFLMSIATKRLLLEEEVKKIFEHRTTIYQIIKGKLDNNKYERLAI